MMYIAEPQSRVANLVVAFLSFAAVIIAVALQEQWKLNPCSLCIAQRYIFLVLGVTAVLRYASPAVFDKGWRVIQGFIGVTGLAVAAKNVYVLVVPSPTCGRDSLSEFLNELPSAVHWPKVFEATGMCSDPIPPVAGIPFPGWSFALFLLLTIMVLRRQH